MQRYFSLTGNVGGKFYSTITKIHYPPTQEVHYKRCVTCGRHQDGAQPLGEVYGDVCDDVWGDIMGSSDTELVISERFYNLIIDNNMKGIINRHSVHVLSVRDKITKTPPPVYYHLEVDDIGELSENECKYFPMEVHCDNCGTPYILKNISGPLNISPERIGDRDIFTYDNRQSNLCISERFLDEVIVTNNLNGMEANPIEYSTMELSIVDGEIEYKSLPYVLVYDGGYAYRRKKGKRLYKW